MSGGSVVGRVPWDLLVDETRLSIEVAERLGISAQDTAEIIVAKFDYFVSRALSRPTPAEAP